MQAESKIFVHLPVDTNKQYQELPKIETKTPSIISNIENGIAFYLNSLEKRPDNYLEAISVGAQIVL